MKPDHIYQGSCPDEWQPDASDPECPACRSAQQAEQQRVDEFFARRFKPTEDFERRYRLLRSFALGAAPEVVAKFDALYEEAASKKEG